MTVVFFLYKGKVNYAAAIPAVTVTMAVGLGFTSTATARAETLEPVNASNDLVKKVLDTLGQIARLPCVPVSRQDNAAPTTESEAVSGVIPQVLTGNTPVDTVTVPELDKQGVVASAGVDSVITQTATNINIRAPPADASSEPVDARKVTSEGTVPGPNELNESRPVGRAEELRNRLRVLRNNFNNLSRPEIVGTLPQYLDAIAEYEKSRQQILTDIIAAGQELDKLAIDGRRAMERRISGLSASGYRNSH